MSKPRKPTAPKAGRSKKHSEAVDAFLAIVKKTPEEKAYLREQFIDYSAYVHALKRKLEPARDRRFCSSFRLARLGKRRLSRSDESVHCMPFTVMFFIERRKLSRAGAGSASLNTASASCTKL